MLEKDDKKELRQERTGGNGGKYDESETMPHLEGGEVIKQIRDRRTEVVTGKQGEHDHLHEKGGREVSARAFPANRKRGAMMRMEGSHRGNSEELRLAVIFRLRLADDGANPLDQFTKVVGLFALCR